MEGGCLISLQLNNQLSALRVGAGCVVFKVVGLKMTKMPIRDVKITFNKRKAYANNLSSI